ncbi:hypothetical protein [Sphingomonas sp. S2-65]|uniref:hypothetical protein n=1 Tax=Sphingomonas sp. S2-65 TaxID=2903960 RepID=UPI001F17AD73|nr:hypothetical protein [Sphingomonas sp. S2-65]UYY57189.1 hypothetical protein LZ586_10870 [Sphingomonas sp. S2-65]
MDVERSTELATARMDSMAVGTVAVAGVAALCNELAAGGLLDDEQLNRIRVFMLISIERSVGSVKLQSAMNEAIGHHFEQLRHRMS